MACKAKTKHANDDSTAPTFRASDTTQHFLATMNQNHHAASKFKMDEYVQIVPLAERSASNPIPNVLTQPEVADTQFDEDDIHKIINAFKIVGPWCEKFTPTVAHDDAYNELKRLVGLIASLFDLIPGPHQCPTPPPPPPPCSRPHRDDEDIPMEPPAPTRAFSEAASQTPAPSHEASTPPPPLAAAASNHPITNPMLT
ncbi:hypothetical protein P691DRAFT_768561 [Macrolepiota fuliginosa MF-IS2]|uniref:Uncharacterized protein n=1 Tax=Macrolepiota fuliginosa MF-IS2 TaxID=1400762 RepID=A0A9P5WXW7_9AGAR|nr:hypothetical protein P691DRAFT_768561 [Macrolepiota fuliginosa MF-IS2]